jgi:hypothetical protein
MTAPVDRGPASTTDSVSAQSQSRDTSKEEATSTPGGPAAPSAGEGIRFLIGEAVRRQPVAPYQRTDDDPLYRPLRIYTMDPAVPKLDGATATVNVPFEPLDPGPVGQLFAVDGSNGHAERPHRLADLDDRVVLIGNGYKPSPSDPRFHQQMVYAVCSNVYSAFRKALGRNLAWGFGSARTPSKLILRVHDSDMRNAYYTKAGDRGEIRFGYFEADKDSSDRGTLPGGFVFTCLSHDIVAHEVTHALLDGLRSHFGVPTGPDVIAFHEAFADLVAIFQHFSYREVLLTAIARCKGKLEDAGLLTQLAEQFGHTTGQHGPLRSAIEADTSKPRLYDQDREPHELGSVLVSAVFEAFTTIFRRKIQVYIRMVTGGSGVLPPGDLPHDLQVVLADKASKLASQFLTICIRAIDYCPPVGLDFGDYLRALITADYDVVPDDMWDYRGALIEAFRRRNIYPRSVANLSEDALLWRGPRQPLPPIEELHFRKLQFNGDPGHAVDSAELYRQACALGAYVADPLRMDEFGLVPLGDRRLEGDIVELPRVESVRSARRAGPDGQIVFDLIGEITQVRHVKATATEPGFSYHGGSTVIMGPRGEIRYVILKNVTGYQREERRRAYINGAMGQRYWMAKGNLLVQRPKLFELIHKAN